MNDFLSQLRDIHLPPEPSWWPPAIGWWVLVLLISLAIIYAYSKYNEYIHSARKLALYEIKQLEERYHSDQDARQLLISLSALLRRLAISVYPRERVASLTGDDWIKWLKSHSADETLNEDIAKTLCQASYQPSFSTEHIDQTLVACRNWILKLHRPTDKKENTDV